MTEEGTASADNGEYEEKVFTRHFQFAFLKNFS